MKTIFGEEVLALRMNPEENDAKANCVKEYLVVLLRTLWQKGESFSGKRPFGNGAWRHDLYKPLIQFGLVKGELDEDGFIQSVDDEAAKQLIESAINALD